MQRYLEEDGVIILKENLEDEGSMCTLDPIG